MEARSYIRITFARKCTIGAALRRTQNPCTTLVSLELVKRERREKYFELIKLTKALYFSC